MLTLANRLISDSSIPRSINIMRTAERWRAVKVTEFERRQPTLVRQEWYQEYEAIIRSRGKALERGRIKSKVTAPRGLDMIKVVEARR